MKNARLHITAEPSALDRLNFNSKSIAVHDLNLLGTGCNEKLLQTLRAEFALRGHKLEVGTDAQEVYWVSRWSHARSFQSLDDLKAFLVAIGGSSL